MMTMTPGGQSFAKAWAGVETALGCATSYAACGAAVPSKLDSMGNPNPAYTAYFNALPAQSFLETALGGATSAYCTGSYAGVAFSSCTAATAFKNLSTFETYRVWRLWSALDKGAFTFPRSMLNTPLAGPFGSNGQLSSGVGVNASVGYGNYNGAFVSLKTTNWHNITLQENFTYSKALGTGGVVQASSEYTPNDPFDLHNMYGVQNFDRKFVFNVYALIDDPYYKGQHGAIGRLLGGWQLSPIFAYGSGAPVYCNTRTDAQSFGAGDGSNFFDNEQCIFTGAHPYGSGLYPSGPGEYNIFKDPAGLLATVRNPILGLDTGTGGNGSVIRGLSYWNVDVRVTKNIKIWERVGFDFQIVATNVFNHPVFYDGGLTPSSGLGSFGQTSAQGNFPRQLQFGMRFSF
jgi:hypothetical protein